MANDARIAKEKITARELLQTIAEVQSESGYPYVMREDTVNRANPINGRLVMSSLCSEILQISESPTHNPWGECDHVGKDISCNLGSRNIALALDGGNIGAAHLPGMSQSLSETGFTHTTKSWRPAMAKHRTITCLRDAVATSRTEEQWPWAHEDVPETIPGRNARALASERGRLTDPVSA